ncbi:hypothetical protein K2Z83_25175 [Oscillochloris sp. ZM17-4]|uniref:hypothetical protein n=1 Tax=Oscillochloris sp. ZM17-4 TaxID=2866714 RepID=UPI001C73702F|nr:hypothetical protein [Oscillochloris sp. ZM17-4]MBX0330954.1 hypothetical protein [Oscillochloris sp. ZM17-4]
MHIPDSSVYPSINAWSRTLAFNTFQSHEIFLHYLRWLDQSYGSTITCTFHANRGVAIGIRGVPQLSLAVADERICVQWLMPEESYWATLHDAVSQPGDLTRTREAGRWQFYVDTKQDSYLLRDLTSHIHR